METNERLETGHIGLNVTDLHRSKQFYQAVFGFDVLKESKEQEKRFAFLGKDQKVIGPNDRSSRKSTPGAEISGSKIIL